MEGVTSQKRPYVDEGPAAAAAAHAGLPQLQVPARAGRSRLSACAALWLASYAQLSSATRTPARRARRGRRGSRGEYSPDSALPACRGCFRVARPGGGSGGGTRAAWTRTPARAAHAAGMSPAGGARQAFFSSACQEDRAHSRRVALPGPPTPRVAPSPSHCGHPLGSLALGQSRTSL